MSSDNAQVFIERIIGLSSAKLLDDALLEWEATAYPVSTEPDCICGHPVKSHYLATNLMTQVTIAVGQDCIRKFPIVRCRKSKMGYLRHARRVAEYSMDHCATKSYEDKKKDILLTEELLTWCERSRGAIHFTELEKARLEKLTGITWKWKYSWEEY